MRLFTAAEANALVPTVRPLLASLRDAFHEFSFAREQLDELVAFGESAGPEARALEATVEARGADVRRLLDLLHDTGCEVKDPTLGLVDFPTRRADGSVVLLCYRDDEETITTWHTVHGGFQGRRPLGEL